MAGTFYFDMLAMPNKRQPGDTPRTTSKHFIHACKIKPKDTRNERYDQYHNLEVSNEARFQITEPVSQYLGQ